MDRIPVSRTGYEKLMGDLKHMEEVEMPAIAIRIAEARAAGDLRENAEYHGARETQGMLQAKINLLRDKLSRADIVDMSQLPKDEVAFGCTVVVKDLDFGDQEEFTLVGAGDEDYDAGHPDHQPAGPRPGWQEGGPKGGNRRACRQDEVRDRRDPFRGIKRSAPTSHAHNAQSSRHIHVPPLANKRFAKRKALPAAVTAHGVYYFTPV
jgi:transcription elongation factor GreA